MFCSVLNFYGKVLKQFTLASFFFWRRSVYSLCSYTIQISSFLITLSLINCKNHHVRSLITHWRETKYVFFFFFYDRRTVVERKNLKNNIYLILFNVQFTCKSQSVNLYLTSDVERPEYAKFICGDM